MVDINKIRKVDLSQFKSQQMPAPRNSGIVFTGAQGVVNLPAKAQEQNQEQKINLQGKINEKKSLGPIETNQKVLDKKALDETGALSGEGATKFNIATAAILNIEDIKKKVEGGSSFILPSIFDRDTDSVMTDLTDLIGRLRSQGQIADKEYDQFAKLLPSALDRKATKLNKLNRLNALFRNLGRQVGTEKRLDEELNLMRAERQGKQNTGEIDIQKIDSRIQEIDKLLGQ